MCGWSERGVEDGREGGVECIDQLGLAFVSDAYHARYPRLTFSLEAADKSFIWTSVHQKEGQRKEGRKKKIKGGRKEEKRVLEARHAECKRTERSRSRHRYFLFLHVTPAFAAGPALSIRASYPSFPVEPPRDNRWQITQQHQYRKRPFPHSTT